MTTQHPHLTVTADATGDLFLECRCGASDWLSKLNGRKLDTGKLHHRRGCSTKPQYQPAGYQAPVPRTAEQQAANQDARYLRRFGASVRRTGLTLGRDEDVLAAVRGGYLSVSDAMNTDD